MISNLKNLRQAANMTQKELAEKTGVSQQKISELERNVPSYVEAIANICHAVGCTFEELFGTTAKLNRCPTAVQPTAADRCDTAALPPVQDNGQTSVISNIFGTFVEVPVARWKFRKYYVQLKSIEECQLDPDCAADVEDKGYSVSVYGIKKPSYEELTTHPVKALYDGIRFYVAANEDFDFDRYQASNSWLVAPRFVKRVWMEKTPEKENMPETTSDPV